MAKVIVDVGESVLDKARCREQLLKSKNASVAGFTLFVVGEGIEKVVTDFAAEVAAAAAGAR